MHRWARQLGAILGVGLGPRDIAVVSGPVGTSRPNTLAHRYQEAALRSRSRNAGPSASMHAADGIRQGFASV